MRSWHAYAYSVTALACVVVALLSLAHWQTGTQVAFMKGALENAGVEETVEVNGHHYMVKGGRVIDHAGALLEEDSIPLRVYTLAYELALARRSPVLAIPGTDTDKLTDAAIDLAENQRHIGALQEDPKIAELVSSSLYPVKFLQALARAEAARREFLGAGNEASARAYQRALLDAVHAYESDARAISRAIETIVKKDRKFVVLAGSIDLSSINGALASIAERASFMRQKLVQRGACINGTLTLCIPEDLKVPTIDVTQEKSETSSLSLANDVISLLSKGYDGAALRQYRPLVALHGSSCADGFPEPHYYLLRVHEKRPEDIRIGALLFVGDLLSYRTDQLMQRTESPNDPIAALREKGVSFAVFSPGNYYLCPSIGEDLGRSVATYKAFVMHYGTSSVARSVADERESQRYIASVLSTPGSSKSVIDEATDIALMFNGKSANLDLIAQEIADYQNGTIRQKEQGLSIDVGAEWEFLVRSGVTALLMFQHNERGIESVSIFSDTLPTRERVPLVRWSDIRTRISESEIIEDIRTLTEFHWGNGH